MSVTWVCLPGCSKTIGCSNPMKQLCSGCKVPLPPPLKYIVSCPPAIFKFKDVICETVGSPSLSFLLPSDLVWCPQFPYQPRPTHLGKNYLEGISAIAWMTSLRMFTIRQWSHLANVLNIYFVIHCKTLLSHGSSSHMKHGSNSTCHLCIGLEGSLFCISLHYVGGFLWDPTWPRPLEAD